MRLLDTYQGSLQDAHQWAEQHGLQDVSLEMVRERLFSGRESVWLAKGRPDRSFRFMLDLNEINVGLYQAF